MAISTVLEYSVREFLKKQFLKQLKNSLFIDIPSRHSKWVFDWIYYYYLGPQNKMSLQLLPFFFHSCAYLCQLGLQLLSHNVSCNRGFQRNPPSSSSVYSQYIFFAQTTVNLYNKAATIYPCCQVIPMMEVKLLFTSLCLMFFSGSICFVFKETLNTETHLHMSAIKVINFY